MAVPKKRTPSSRRDRRRSHHARGRVTLVACPQCREPKMPHSACLNCGTYNGREVIDVLAKLDKKEKKAKARQSQSNEN